ncbi:MAG: amidohydrolase [Coriobacteriales bacterium]|jgi:5-methylthioadenosine/S-adenosylhomocysteine deaminase|nr:amidohydrolase [Coriobacteriales bacterium]
MLFSNIDYLTPDFGIAHGFVGTEGASITYLGDTLPEQPERFGECYDGRGKVLMPGLYNTHTHAPMTLLRGYGENLTLQDWLYKRVFPFEAKITDASTYPATLLAIAEMLRFGTVSFTDMYFYSAARIRAIEESGIKCNLCDGIMVFDPETRFEDLPASEENRTLIRDYHGAFDGRLRIDLNIHSEYISNPFVVRSVGELAAELGVHTHTHISETRLEHEECKERRGGLTPVAYFDSLDFFRAPCTAAHCVWTEPEDWEILAEREVFVAANPASNMKLASGFAPVPQMLDAGVNVALGTDGMASNNNHNLFKDLYLLATIYKGSTGDPTVVTPAQALAAATVVGARSQGRPKSGAIELEYRADLVVVDVQTPWMQPVHDQVSNLVFAAQGSDVVLTMVDGTVLYREGTWPTIDVEKALVATQQASDAILASLLPSR